MFWDERDGSLSVAETNGGCIFRLDPRTGELLDEWRIEGSEVHGLTRSADGRIWIGDASTNQVLMVERPDSLDPGTRMADYRSSSPRRRRRCRRPLRESWPG